MKVIDSKTGNTFFQKRRRRCDEPGPARELTFSCHRGHRFLTADRVRGWFLESLVQARQKAPFDL